jgi:hypothetical protein
MYMEVETVQAGSPVQDDADITDSPNLVVVDDDTDEAQPWFAGDMRRTACERAVAMAQHGDFLIRRSRSKTTSGPSSFVLVVNIQVRTVLVQLVTSPFDLSSLSN